MRKIRNVNVPAYHKERHECLGSSPTLIDEKMLIIGLFAFDVFALERWLVRLHGPIPDNVSMKEFLLLHYGAKAVRFVEKWLRADPPSGVQCTEVDAATSADTERGAAA